MLNWMDNYTWLEISLKEIRHNIEYLLSLNENNKKSFILMVKANAYGHGIEEIAHLAELLGASHLGVCSIGDIQKIRDSGVRTPIILFNPANQRMFQFLIDNDVEIIVGDAASLESLIHANPSARPRYHLKLNTGLGRFGFSENELPDVLDKIKYLDVPAGIYTHFSCANDDLKATGNEFAYFVEALQKFHTSGISPRYIHASNSAASAWLKESITNTVRLGIAAYGLQPNNNHLLSVRPALEWHSRLVSIHTASKNSYAGYNHSWQANRDTRVGIVSIGYSDGLHRSLTGGKLLCNGNFVPIIGTIMMNQTLVDLSEAVDAVVGDTVTIIGENGGKRIAAEDIAAYENTINEEVVTSIQQTIHRSYIT